MSATVRKLLVALAIAAVSLAAAFFLSRLPLSQTMEWKIYDLEFRRLRNQAELADKRIVMVTIDDLSVQKMAEAGFGRFPWLRDTYKVVLDYFARAKPKVVAFDIVFPEADRSTVVDKSGVADKTGSAADHEFVEG